MGTLVGFGLDLRGVLLQDLGLLSLKILSFLSIMKKV